VISDPDLEAYHKDEIIAGYEWQFSDNWALDVKGIWWKVDNLISSTTQLAFFNGKIDVFTLTANTDDVANIMTAIYNAAPATARPFLAQPASSAQYVEPDRNYKALQIQLNRRFADGWGLFSNVTWSEAAGSSHGDVFNNTNDTYGENLDQVMTQTDITNCNNRQVSVPRAIPIDCTAAWTQYLGVPLSIINRDGRADFDRTIIAKSSGWKVFSITAKQSFTLGGHLTFQTGKPWERTEGAGGTAINPALSGIPLGLGVSVPLEERGSREITSHWWLNLSGAYAFPLGSKVSGEVRLEIQNATDNQRQVGVESDGEVRPLRRGFQRPRRLRLLGSVKF